MVVMSTDEDWLRALADFGPFFAVGSMAGPQWQPLRTLLDAATLDERVTRVRAEMSAMAGAAIDRRVAASTMSLGLFARLVSPVLAAAALGLRLPWLSLDASWWRPVDRGPLPLPLALTGPAADADPAGAITEVVDPIAARLADRCSLSMTVLRGNVASAVFGAATVVRSVRPDLSPAVGALGVALLSATLAGTGTMRGRRFVRSSCCLYYRVPGGGYCGDCVLAQRH